MNRDTFAGTIDVEFELDGPKRLRGGDKREAPVPEASAPRLTRLMALAIKCLGMVERSEVLDYAELARVGYVTRARMSQIMNLVNLAPDIQEEILFLPKVSAVGPAARRVAQAAPGAPVLAVDALQCETDRTGWPVPPHKLVLARNNRRAPRKVPEQIVQHGVEQAFRSEGLLQTLVRDRLRIANTRNAQENNSRCNVLRRACDRSRRVQALYDRVARCFDGSASPHVLVQVSQRGCQDLLGRMRLSQARIRDRLRNPGGTERGNQQRIAFCPKGQDYPKTNMKSNVFSPCIHTLMRRLGVEFKHALQQSFHLLPAGPVRVAMEIKCFFALYSYPVATPCGRIQTCFSATVRVPSGRAGESREGTPGGPQQTPSHQRFLASTHEATGELCAPPPPPWQATVWPPPRLWHAANRPGLPE
jgi:hypothetical protein